MNTASAGCVLERWSEFVLLVVLTNWRFFFFQLLNALRYPGFLQARGIELHCNELFLLSRVGDALVILCPLELKFASEFLIILFHHLLCDFRAIDSLSFLVRLLRCWVSHFSIFFFFVLIHHLIVLNPGKTRVVRLVLCLLLGSRFLCSQSHPGGCQNSGTFAFELADWIVIGGRDEANSFLGRLRVLYSGIHGEFLCDKPIAAFSNAFT